MKYEIITGFDMKFLKDIRSVYSANYEIFYTYCVVSKLFSVYFLYSHLQILPWHYLNGQFLARISCSMDRQKSGYVRLDKTWPTNRWILMLKRPDLVNACLCGLKQWCCYNRPMWNNSQYMEVQSNNSFTYWRLLTSFQK